MNLLPLNVLPGFFRNGTEYEAKGRWYDGNLVRWVHGVMQAVGGWVGYGNGYAQETNVLLYSNALGTTPWSVGAGSITTDETVANHYDPLEATHLATEITDPGSTAAAYLEQTVGVLTDAEETFAVVVEKVSGATLTDIEVYDATADGVVVRLRLTWGDLTVAVDDETLSSGASVSVRDMGISANGGALVRVIVTAVPDNSGNVRALRIYPTGIDDAEACVLVVHHAGYYEQDGPGGIVWTEGVAVTQNANRIAVDSPVLGMTSWRDDSDVQRLAIGTTCQVWTYAEGVLDEITPTGLTCGGSRAVAVAGVYGAGAYGAGVYGGGDATLESVAEAQSWQFDQWGQYLLALAQSDGVLYEWQLTGSLAAVSNAPVDNLGLVVTPERFVMLLGAGGDGRLIQWCDQEDNTVWTPSSANQAGDFPISGSGRLMCGRSGRRETLLWTTNDMHVAQYVGGTLIYRITRVGSNCGIISRRAVAVVSAGQAYWMGNNNFYAYDGVVKGIPSDVSDYVFNDLNRQQRSQITCVPISATDEVVWYYPSGGSLFNDRYVALNTNDGTWTFGVLARTAGTDRGVFNNPLLGDRFGVVYAHESGFSYADFLGEEAVPYAESGPVEIGPGERVAFVRNIITDEKTTGDVNITLSARMYPNSAVHKSVTYTPTNLTNTRISGREWLVKVEQVNPNWRFGTQRFDVEIGGSR